MATVNQLVRKPRARKVAKSNVPALEACQMCIRDSADTVQISRAREARRELEEIFQREMQQERRQLDGWDEFE